MKVSVIIITYNHERFIAQAMESVLMQETDFDFEVVVGDDCSTDRTREIVLQYGEKYPGTVHPILPDRNEGGNRVFDRALRMCTGEYIAMLEGDDYWTSPYKLQKQAGFLETHTDAALCFHNTLVVYEDGRKSHLFHLEKPAHRLSLGIPKPFSTIEDLLQGNFIRTCSAMFRAGRVRELPEWFFELPVGDWPLHIMNAEHGTIGYMDEVLAAYRVHATSSWASKSSLYMIPRLLEVYEHVNRHLGYRYDARIRALSIQLLDQFIGELRNTVGSLQGERALENALEEFDALMPALPDVPGLRYCGALLLAQHTQSLKGVHEKESCSLLERFDTAEVLSGKPEQVSVWDASVDGETCRALFMQPPARVRFAIDNGLPGRFAFAVMIHPDAWEKSAAGCSFAITVDGETKRTVQSVPSVYREDRHWREHAIDVDEAASNNHDIVLETQGLGGSTDFRWALWRDLRFIPSTPIASKTLERNTCEHP